MLSSFDSKLLSLLMQEGRRSWADLADELGVSPPAIAEKVKRLEQTGLIRGFAALLSPEAIGCQVTAFVHLALSQEQERKSFLKYAESLTEIQECHHITGDWDYLIKVRAHSTSDLERILTELKQSCQVARTSTAIALSSPKESQVLPLSDRLSTANQEPKPTKVRKRETKK